MRAVLQAAAIKVATTPTQMAMVGPVMWLGGHLANTWVTMTEARRDKCDDISAIND